MNFVLQEIQFPHSDICGVSELYFRGDKKCVINGDRNYCIVPRYSDLDLLTYINSFTIGKWRKYTRIKNLSIQLEIVGRFLIKVEYSELINDQLNRKVIATQEVNESSRDNINIKIPVELTNGLLSLRLIAISEGCEFYGGFYYTEIEENEIKNINIAIDICTFRREKYVKANLKQIEDNILYNNDSPLHGRINIFISDNAKTLEEELNNEYVHIFPNKNVGGAGGFTRGMIEIIQWNKEHDNQVSHIIMMDDDVLFSYGTLLKTYSLLALLKDEYKEAFIGGHMLRLNQMSVQSEAADYYEIFTHHPVNDNFELSDPENVIRNEKDIEVNYFSWWYCCMPAEVIQYDNLPLPIFIKRDDIEYGLRNGTTFITMNGINVWHESFDLKYSSYLNYYYIRNMLILTAKHRAIAGRKNTWHYITREIFKNLALYRYRDAELQLKGVEDFLKGVDWLMNQDMESLNQKIIQLGYKKETLDIIKKKFNYSYVRPCKEFRNDPFSKLCRIVSLNGWLLPAKGNVVVPMYRPAAIFFYRAKEALNVEDSTGTGYITQKDCKALFATIKYYFRIGKTFFKNYTKVRTEYVDRYGELININNWNNQLFKTLDCEDVKSVLPERASIEGTKREQEELKDVKKKIAIQKALSWIPLKKNKVIISVDRRRGFTCNPKYIAKELMKEFGESIELLWATDYPESCEEISQLGIRVIQKESKEHFREYLRCKVYITNDMFPAWAMQRKDRMWINAWHGAMNYKHIGYKYLAPRSELSMELFKRKNRQPDVYIAGSRFFAEDTAESFNFDKQIFVKTGLPRNDIFFEDHSEINAKVRRIYQIPPETKIVIYAPTFRRGMKSATYGMEFDRLKKALSNRFGGEWVVLFRNHSYVSGKADVEGAIDVSNYDDMNELMCAADVLISDYSSCMYDFVLQEKPCFVYASDLQYYAEEDRTLAYPVSLWPYPIAATIDELEDNIVNFDEKPYIEKVRDHFEQVGRYDDGEASRKIAQMIGKHCGLC